MGGLSNYNIPYNDTDKMRELYINHLSSRADVYEDAFPHIELFIQNVRKELIRGDSAILKTLDDPNVLLRIGETIQKTRTELRLIEPGSDRALGAYIWAVRSSFAGFGPVEELLTDDDVTDIHIHRYDDITIKRRSQSSEGTMKTNIVFPSEQELKNTLSTMLSIISGKQIDDKNPIQDGILPGGERLVVLIPPIAPDGTLAAIRKQAKYAFTPEKLLEFRAFTPQVNEFLKLSIMAELNLIIMGATGSGKTATTSALLRYIPYNKNLLTIEDTRELQVESDRYAYTPLTVRKSGTKIQSSGSDITIYDCLKAALRLDPDYIVVGETRGEEAWEMLQAMKSGHSGITTVHAADGPECLTRIEGMCAMANDTLSPEYLRRDIAQIINLMVVQTWVGVGQNRRRGIQSVYEVMPTHEKGHEPPEDVLPSSLALTNEFLRTNNPLYVRELGAATLRKLFYFDENTDQLEVGVLPSNEFIAKLRRCGLENDLKELYNMSLDRKKKTE